MATPQHGPFAKTFIAINRIFGIGAIVGGIFILGIVVVALIESGEFSKAIPVLWPFGVGGIVLVVVGVIYMRAPLYRERKE